jgi:hypothetical protein
VAAGAPVRTHQHRTWNFARKVRLAAVA